MPRAAPATPPTRSPISSTPRPGPPYRPISPSKHAREARILPPAPGPRPPFSPPLPQFQRRQRKQRQHQSRNPEPCNDLRFRPAQRFEVMMQWSHFENAFAAAQLEAAHLQNHRDRFQNENAADEQQQHF